MSTIKNADLICVLVEGEIDEMGTHDELMEKNGVYAVLCRSQALVEKHRKNSDPLAYSPDGDDYNNDENNDDNGMTAGNGTTATSGNGVTEEEENDAPPAYQDPGGDTNTNTNENENNESGNDNGNDNSNDGGAPATAEDNGVYLD